MSEPLIAFDGVWKKFRRGEHHDSLRDLIPAMAKRIVRRRPPTLATDEFWVLQDVSFEVRPGQALGIIGPNGAGKSTALKLLTRILKPTRGQARVQGRAGALIELAAGFHADLTGRENVFMQGAIMGMRRDEVRKRFDEIVAFAGIPDFIDTPVKRYSSGMNARLGFAVAAHLDPEVLLIDEVLAVGDFTFQQKCFERLRAFRRAGIPIAFVSHNLQAIASLCDTVLVLTPDEAPFLAGVEEAVAKYTSGQPVLDPRVRVQETSVRRLEGGSGAGRSSQIRPGDSVEVIVRFEVVAHLPRTMIGIEVLRADGVVVFNGSPMLDGEPALDFTPGMVRIIRVRLRANLLRGTYLVNIHLVDEQRVWPAILLARAGSFMVHETTRVSGFAELEPQLTVTPVAVDEVKR